MDQVVGSLPPTLEAWTELLAPGFGLVRPWLLQALEEWISRWKITLLCVPLPF